MNLTFSRCRDINGPLMEAALALYHSSFPAHELRLPPDQRDEEKLAGKGLVANQRRNVFLMVNGTYTTTNQFRVENNIADMTGLIAISLIPMKYLGIDKNSVTTLQQRALAIAVDRNLARNYIHQLQILVPMPMTAINSSLLPVTNIGTARKKGDFMALLLFFVSGNTHGRHLANHGFPSLEN